MPYRHINAELALRLLLCGGLLLIKFNFKIIAFILAACSLLLVCGCGGRQSVIIGISKNSAPLSYQDSEGSPDGFIVDMAREVGKRMGLQVVFKYVDVQNGALNFKSEGVDAVWGKIEPDSSNKMLFTVPYLYDSQVFVVKQSDKFSSVSDLNGKAVGAVEDANAYKILLKANIPAIKGGKPTSFKEPVSAFLALDKGSVSAIAIDESYARNRMAQHAEQYKMLANSLASEKYAVAVRRNDSELRDSFEKALNSMKSDGTSSKISKIWFDKDMTAD